MTITNLPMRVVLVGSDLFGTLTEAPIVEHKQIHPNICVLFFPDSNSEPIQVWTKVEAQKYFLSEERWRELGRKQ